MDLGQCPRCGTAWESGKELCAKCGFVPIGAGLRQLNDEAEQRVQRRLTFSGLEWVPVREPGSKFGLVMTAAFLLLIGAGVRGTVWANDWEPVRVMTGEKPSTAVAGAWGISKSQQLDGRGAPTQTEGLTGTLQFGTNGALRLRFWRGFSAMEAVGTYRVKGNRIIVEGLRGSNGPAGLPQRVGFNIVYRTADSLVLDIEKQERLTLVPVEPQ